LKHLVEALEKKAIRAERFVGSHINSKDGLEAEIRRLNSENKAMREILNKGGDLSAVNNLLEQLTATVVTGNAKGSDDILRQGKGQAIEWIR
jgi:hypothetical protein